MSHLLLQEKLSKAIIVVTVHTVQYYFTSSYSLIHTRCTARNACLNNKYYEEKVKIIILAMLI